MIRWQPGFVYPPVFYPPHPQLDAVSAVVFALVTIGAGVVALRRPANGVAAMIACTPFAFAHYVGNTSVTVPKAALIGFVAALLWRRCSLGVIREPHVVRLLAAIGFAVAAMALSGIGAEHKDAVIREIGKWLEYAALFVAVAVASRTPKTASDAPVLAPLKVGDKAPEFAVATTAGPFDLVMIGLPNHLHPVWIHRCN